MKLHRVKDESDWSLVKEEQRNKYQRLAAASRGIITPGNASTLLGLGLVITGVFFLLSGSNTYGFVVIAAGRLLDIVDGAIAHATKTKSRLGEAFDSIADKIAILIVLVVYVALEIMPLLYVLALLILQTVTSISVAIIKRKGNTIHTPRIGKISSFVMWVSIGLFSILYLLGDSSTALIAQITAHFSFFFALVLNTRSTSYYVKRAL